MYAKCSPRHICAPPPNGRRRGFDCAFAIVQKCYSSHRCRLRISVAVPSKGRRALVDADLGYQPYANCNYRLRGALWRRGAGGIRIASRLELLISSLVLAFGIGTTTMVGICVGAGLAERARRVTFISCALAAAVFEALGFCVAASGRWVTELFTNIESVVFAGTAYFQVMGLVYGFMAVSAMPFSAYQGWGRAVAPLLVSLLRFAIVLLVGWMVLRTPVPRLDLLYYLVASSVILAAMVLGSVFLFWPPNRSGSAFSSGKGNR